MNDVIQCLNYIVCGNTASHPYLGGTCVDCDFFFCSQQIDILQDKTCCVCADDELQMGIKFPSCNHSVCIDHMKEYYQNNRVTIDSNHIVLFENSTNLYKPEFPYDENVKNAYDLYRCFRKHDSQVNFENDELIIKYEIDSDNYCETRDYWIENNFYKHKPALEKCPLCREKLQFSGFQRI